MASNTEPTVNIIGNGAIKTIATNIRSGPVPIANPRSTRERVPALATPRTIRTAIPITPVDHRHDDGRRSNAPSGEWSIPGMSSDDRQILHVRDPDRFSVGSDDFATDTGTHISGWKRRNARDRRREVIMISLLRSSRKAANRCVITVEEHRRTTRNRDRPT